MIGRLAVVAGLFGAGAAHQLSELPSWPWTVAAVLMPAVMLSLSGFLIHRAPRVVRASRVLALWLLAAGLAFAVTVFWAQQRLDQVLEDSNVDRVSRVVLRVQGLPRLQPDRIRFEADVLDSHPAGVPQRILVSWPAAGWRSPYAAARPADPPFPVVRAGQVWRMALVLRPIQAAQNIAAFDYEGHVFAAGIRASGTVRGAPEYLRDENWHSVAVIADRARHRIRQAMAPHLDGKRYGAVLRALAIGDQDGMDDVGIQVSREVRSLSKHMIYKKNKKSQKIDVYK